MSEGIKRCSDYSVTKVSSKEFIYTWKITNFKSLHPGLGQYVTSKKVSDDGKGVWDVQVYPDGYDNSYKDYLAVQILFDRQPSQIEYPTYLLILYIIDKNGMEYEFYRTFSNGALCKTLEKRDYVLDEKNGLLPNGNLTLRFKTYFTSKVTPLYDNKSKSVCNIYHVYNKSKLNVLINFIRKNFTYFTNDVVHKPALASILESKLNALENMFDSNNEQFSDVNIVVGDKVFHVYKGILAAQSPVFAAMFHHNMIERNENTVHIADFDHEVIQEMLRFIYAGKVNNIEVVARDLLAAAEKYELEQLKTMCEETLINDLNVDTATSLLILADKYDAKILKGSVLEFFIINAKEIIQTQAYKADLHSLLPLLPEILERLVL